MRRLLRNLWSNTGFPWRLVRIILLLIIGLAGLLMAFEDKLIYFPTRYPDGFWAVNSLPAREGEVVPKVEDCFFSTSDGVLLHGWYCTPHLMAGGSTSPVETHTVLLWFHGNAGNLSYRYEMIRAMMAAIPLRIFIIDYRGYGKSEGHPSEAGLYLDARASWDYLTSQRGIAPEQIVIFGKSLGGVPAVDLASRVNPGGLIVQSSFTSAGDMAASLMPFLPRFMLHTKMDSLSKIDRVGCKKLFIHSRDDEVVPFELGQRLYEHALEPKQFYEVIGAPHNSTYLVGGKMYFDALRGFIESCASK